MTGKFYGYTAVPWYSQKAADPMCKCQKACSGCSVLLLGTYSGRMLLIYHDLVTSYATGLIYKRLRKVECFWDIPCFMLTADELCRRQERIGLYYFRTRSQSFFPNRMSFSAQEFILISWTLQALFRRAVKEWMQWRTRRPAFETALHLCMTLPYCSIDQIIVCYVHLYCS